MIPEPEPTGPRVQLIGSRDVALRPPVPTRTAGSRRWRARVSGRADAADAVQELELAGMSPVSVAGVEQVCSLVQGGPDYRDMPRAVGRGLDVLEIRCAVAARSTLLSLIHI